jgi:hypothetical protein
MAFTITSYTPTTGPGHGRHPRAPSPAPASTAVDAVLVGGQQATIVGTPPRRSCSSARRRRGRHAAVTVVDNDRRRVATPARPFTYTAVSRPPTRSSRRWPEVPPRRPQRRRRSGPSVRGITTIKPGCDSPPRTTPTSTPASGADFVTGRSRGRHRHREARHRRRLRRVRPGQEIVRIAAENPSGTPAAPSSPLVRPHRRPRGLHRGSPRAVVAAGRQQDQRQGRLHPPRPGRPHDITNPVIATRRSRSTPR